MRRPYSESFDVFGRGETLPPLLGRRPRYDEDEGIDCFRAAIEDERFDALTLPHLYACRAGFARTSFVDSDLSQSVLVWSDLENVDLSRADLHDSDLRNSRFIACEFVGTNLNGCDLRGSEFSGCNFEDASLAGAVLTKEQLNDLSLSSAQRSAVTIETDDDAPGG